MPKIAATSIEEHVRQQNVRIVVAAKKLFARQGFNATDMGQIASAIGLARNSLYRYFPNKEHILLACIQQDMTPHLERLTALAVAFPEPQPRIMAWLDAQFALATGPAHATMELIAEVRDASARLGREITQLHQAPNAVLAEALAALPANNSEPKILATMINGMVLAATAAALELPAAQRPQVLDELRRAVTAIIA
jgi:AcrR family transcriptional regulator